MPKYSYTARDKKGEIHKGVMLASSEHDLALILKNQGLLLTSATIEKEGKVSTETLARIFGRISLREKVLFSRHIYVMIKSGLSLSKALGILAQQTSNKKFKKIIQNIKTDIEKGQSFATALAKHPKVFSPFYINMVRAGETSGKLEETMNHLADQLKKDYNLISKVRSATIYPITVLTTMLIVGTLMIVYVLPQLAEIFKEIKVELPLSTRIIIAISDIITNFGVFILLGILGLIVLFFVAIKSKTGKQFFHKLLLKLPLISPIVKKINLARFARTLSTLLISGVSIIKSFEIVSDILGNVYYKKFTHQATVGIKKGVKIVDVLEKDERLFPKLVTQMVAVGEETGTLDKILKDLADFYEADVTRTMDDLSSIIEPILLIILGIIVAIVAISVISPIYSLVQHF